MKESFMLLLVNEWVNVKFSLQVEQVVAEVGG